SKPSSIISSAIAKPLRTVRGSPSPCPLSIMRNLTGDINGLSSLKDRKDPIWVPERLMRKVQPQLPDDEVDITAAAAAATPSPAESHGATLGDSVCIPEADADIA
ncbi:hypothetical protein STEG23_036818, partial [Scotinomys teguina]